MAPAESKHIVVSGLLRNLRLQSKFYIFFKSAIFIKTAQFAEIFKVTKQILQLFFEKYNFHKNCTFVLKFDETVRSGTCWVQACRCEWFAEEFKATKQILQLLFEKCNFHKNCTFVLKFDETVQSGICWVQAYRCEWFAEIFKVTKQILQLFF